MSNTAQIFQTSNAKRWKSFKWSFRIISMPVIFFVLILTLALIRGTNPSLPNLQSTAKAYQTKLDPANPLTFSEGFNKKYKGFKEFLEKK